VSARRAVGAATSPIWVLNLTLIAIAGTLYFDAVRDLPAPSMRPPFAWLIFALLFFIT